MDIRIAELTGKDMKVFITAEYIPETGGQIKRF